jgi:hypothetical protein
MVSKVYADLKTSGIYLWASKLLRFPHPKLEQKKKVKPLPLGLKFSIPEWTCPNA